MRACFLGQNVFALGYGVATLQSPPLVLPLPPLPTGPDRPLPTPDWLAAGAAPKPEAALTE
jgi:hypothetical protein